MRRVQPESGQRPLKIFTSLQSIKDMQDKYTQQQREKGEKIRRAGEQEGRERGRERAR